MKTGRKRIYKDDILINRTFRISTKYELNYILQFIEILRKYRTKAIEFINSYL